MAKISHVSVKNLVALEDVSIALAKKEMHADLERRNKTEKHSRIEERESKKAAFRKTRLFVVSMDADNG